MESQWKDVIWKATVTLEMRSSCSTKTNRRKWMGKSWCHGIQKGIQRIPKSLGRRQLTKLDSFAQLSLLELVCPQQHLILKRQIKQQQTLIQRWYKILDSTALKKHEETPLWEHPYTVSQDTRHHYRHDVEQKHLVQQEVLRVYKDIAKLR